MKLPLTLTENWQSFDSCVIPAGAPDLQRNEMRRAFYAGFLRAFEIMTGPIAEMDDDGAVSAMNILQDEIIAYMQECMAVAGISLEQAQAQTDFQWADAPEGSKPQ